MLFIMKKDAVLTKIKTEKVIALIRADSAAECVSGHQTPVPLARGPRRHHSHPISSRVRRSDFNA